MGHGVSGEMAGPERQTERDGGARACAALLGRPKKREGQQSEETGSGPCGEKEKDGEEQWAGLGCQREREGEGEQRVSIFPFPFLFQNQFRSSSNIISNILFNSNKN